ncbi:Eukaryotic translation initiation factor 4B [Taxawa tesnikishii (nom. ined.)]|nr:Eukaryotic translation initiation factor 4B [Dothideales sp. JES 119]
MAPKKNKQVMSIGDFLADQSLGSWADEMDSVPVPAAPSYGAGRSGAFTGGFGGDRGAGGFGDRGGFAERPRSNFREQLPLPNKPPYTAHLGNLSFDVTEGDIQDLLSGCEVTSVRIVEDKMDKRPKGFGYVEFATVDGLKKALEKSETQFQGRNIRISVADPPKDRPEARELNDWTRKGPLPDLPGQNVRRPSERTASFRRDDYAGSDAGSERGGPAGRSRSGFFEGDGKVRDFGNWERKGPLSPVPQAERPMREGGRAREGGAPRERKLSPAWGEGTGRSEAGSRPPRREFQERPPPAREPTASEMDNQWRAKMKPDAPSPAATPDQLQMPPPQHRIQKQASSAPPARSTRPLAREIDEKRQLAIRQRKEQEEKAREEKKARESAAKAEQADRPASSNRRESEAAPKENGKSDAKEGDATSPPPGRQYEILRRMGEDGEEVDPEDANGDIPDDREVKPQEVVREAPKTQDTWRKPAPAPEQTTAEGMEDEGWSTVSAPRKNNRRGGNRALAS